MKRTGANVLVLVVSAGSCVDAVKHASQRQAATGIFDVVNNIKDGIGKSIKGVQKVRDAAAGSLNQTESCTCLNWKDTYHSRLVECGHGLEFTRAIGYPKAEYPTVDGWLSLVQGGMKRKALQLAMGAEFCQSFFLRNDGTKCVRAAMDSHPTEWWGRSWCYVSHSCASATPVGESGLAVKLCEEGTDDMLEQMKPESLIQYGAEMGFFVPGYFVKVAYPNDRSFYWKDRSSHEDHVRELMSSGKPWLVDKVDEHKEKMIIFGHKVYQMDKSYAGVRCVEGCDEQDAACGCLPWADVYKSKGVTCGQGRELKMFGMAGRKDAHLTMNAGHYNEFCTRFFMNSNHSACYNEAFGPSDRQWCYVPARCSQAAVGAGASMTSARVVDGTVVAVHECSQESGDELMRDKTPEDLNKMAAASGLAVGLFGKMSYTMHNMKWSQVEGASSLPADKLNQSHTMESFYGIKWSGPANVTEKGRQTWQAATSSESPTIFDADNGHGGGTLVLGSKVYAFLPKDKHMEYVCIEGC